MMQIHTNEKIDRVCIDWTTKWNIIYIPWNCKEEGCEAYRGGSWFFPFFSSQPLCGSSKQQGLCLHEKGHDDHEMLPKGNKKRSQRSCAAWLMLQVPQGGHMMQCWRKHRWCLWGIGRAQNSPSQSDDASYWENIAS